MLEPPRYCADLFSTLDPDVLMNTMVRLAVDQSGKIKCSGSVQNASLAATCGCLGFSRTGF